MDRVRGKFWIPRLRQLTRKIKRLQVRALAVLTPSLLPKEKKEGSAPFEIIGVDFAGLIHYRKSSRVEGKVKIEILAVMQGRALEARRT